MKTLLKNRKKCLVFSIILLLQTIVMLYWGTQKAGYFCDEMYTYGLSNNHNEWHLYLEDDYLNTWHDSSLWHDYLTVQEGHRFDYATVIRNQSEDVHPPVYYFIIHTICSFFPEQFSKWMGLFPNFIFFILSQTVFYLILSELVSDRKSIWVPWIIYGFSVGAINTVMLIRMYMMLTFLFLLQFYIHLHLWRSLENKNKKKENLLLLATYALTILGFMTQYYFLIFAFFLSAGYSIYQLLRRRWNHFLKYALAMFAAIGTGYLLFPACYEHILGSGYRGQEAVENMAKADLMVKIQPFFQFLSNELFLGTLNILFSISIVLIAIKLLKHWVSISIDKQDSSFHYTINFRKFSGKFDLYICENQLLYGIAGLALLGYFLIVSKISHNEANRYLFPVYPFALMIVYGLICAIARMYIKNPLPLNVGLLCLALTGNIVQYHNNNVDYLYFDQGQYYQMIADSYPDTGALYVTFGDWSYVFNVPLLQQYEKTFCIAKEDVADTVDVINEYAQTHDFLFLHISYTYRADWERIAKEIVDLSDFNTYTFMYENSDGIFLLTKDQNENALIPNGYYNIYTSDGQFSLAVDNNSIENNANVLVTDIKGYNQDPQFFVYWENDHHLISFKDSQKMLDVVNGLQIPKTNVHIYERNGWDAQFWHLEETTDGLYYIRFKKELVLAFDPISNNVYLEEFTGKHNQKWMIQKAS